MNWRVFFVNGVNEEYFLSMAIIKGSILNVETTNTTYYVTCFRNVNKRKHRRKPLHVKGIHSTLFIGFWNKYSGHVVKTPIYSRPDHCNNVWDRQIKLQFAQRHTTVWLKSGRIYPKWFDTIFLIKGTLMATNWCLYPKQLQWRLGLLTSPKV